MGLEWVVFPEGRATFPAHVVALGWLCRLITRFFWTPMGLCWIGCALSISHWTVGNSESVTRVLWICVRNSFASANFGALYVLTDSRRMGTSGGGKPSRFI